MADSATFENYEILRREDGLLWELGRGAMGVTYKAVDSDLHCEVALKIINTQILSGEEAVQRFYREARSAAQLRHTNIAAIYRLGKAQDGSPFYAMEFCEGATVQQLVDSTGRLDVAQALEITLQVSKALVVAEKHHVVHRDLKPANLIVTQSGDEPIVVKVIDFGLAKMSGETSGWTSISGQGFVGTAHFASPEQIESGTVDTRSDIYSLGATLFFILAGKPLFEGSPARIISQHLTSEPPYHILPPLPAGVLDLIKQMLAKDPAARPATASGLRKQIESIISELQSSTGNKPMPLPSAVPVAPTAVTAPPDPPSPPGSASTPSKAPTAPVTLLDLMKARGVLSPAEALQLAEPLAVAVDSNPSGSLILIKQAVRIYFQQKEPSRPERDLLRLSLSEWPPFRLEPEWLSAAEMPSTPNPELTISSSGTIVPGLNSSSGSIGALASLIYELVGGTPSKRYVPVARLSEAQNLVLQRGITLGSVMFTSAQEMVADLHKNALDTRIAPASPPPPPPPPATPDPQKERPDKSAVRSPAPSLVSVSKKVSRSFFRTREGRQMAMAGVGILVLVSAIVAVVAASGLFESSETDRPKENFNPIPTKQLEVPHPALTNGNNGSNKNPSLDDLAKKYLPATPKTVPPKLQDRPLINSPASPIKCTIIDDLGEGQLSEFVWLFVNQQPITNVGGAAGPNITIDKNHRRVDFAFIVQKAGYYEVGASAVSTVVGGLSGRQIKGEGSARIYIGGGETFRLSSELAPDGSSFTIQFIPVR